MLCVCVCARTCPGVFSSAGSKVMFYPHSSLSCRSISKGRKLDKCLGSALFRVRVISLLLSYLCVRACVRSVASEPRRVYAQTRFVYMRTHAGQNGTSTPATAATAGGEMSYNVRFGFNVSRRDAVRRRHYVCHCSASS